MSRVIDPDVVARESAAWVWYPDDATVVETADWLLVRWPDYYGYPPSLMRFRPTGDVGASLEKAAEQACAWNADRLTCTVALDAPEGFEELLLAGGATAYETADVFALDLGRGLPQLAVPEGAELRWRVDPVTVRAGAEVGREAFGEGAVLPEEKVMALADEYAADFDEGRGGSVVGYLDGRPVAIGGVTVAGATARLWGGGVRPEARGRGAYRAVLDARLRYAVDHGATMALVKGRVETSGPILRRAGFTAYGQERSYRLPLP